MNSPKLLASGILLAASVVFTVNAVNPAFDCSSLTAILSKLVDTNQQSTDQLKVEAFKAISEAKIIKDKLTEEIESLKLEKKHLIDSCRK
jgi:TPP-dependent trihydroxycyclohexane-1,2-dione (THcHDO) dehydratase